MKTAIVTTTIGVPKVLDLYTDVFAKGDVTVFVATDQKTDTAAYEFCAANSRIICLPPSLQHNAGYECSDLIGWNCIQRRNIATLEAIKSGASLIISIDDDNIPLTRAYKASMYSTFVFTFSGLQASSVTGGFDVGTLLRPQARHRGFPYHLASQVVFNPIAGAKVGVAAGICLGDPDVDATFRMEHRPEVHQVSEVLQAGVVVDPKDTMTVFNSQNTAFIRQVAPAMFMPPGIGRYDDIVASLVTQRVMQELGLVVHFGKPFVWQQRNAHDLLVDLKNEMWGMENIMKVHEILSEYYLAGGLGVIEWVRKLYRQLDRVLPRISVEAALAWCNDCERVMR